MNDCIITPICLDVKVSNRDHYAGAKATIDSAYKGVIINKTWVRKHRFPTYTLNNPICVRNIDNTINKAGLIRFALDVNLTIWDIHGRTHIERVQMFISNLGKDDLILETDWLKYHDPSIKWRQREVHFDWCPQKCHQPHRFTKEREEPQNDRRLRNVEPWHKPRIRKQATGEPVIRKLAPEPSGFASFDQDLEDEIIITNLKERVPKAYHEFLDIFSKRKSQRLPEYTYWDHAIDLKPTFKPQVPKIYALNSSPIFFIRKKDGKLRPVQDYHHLNSHTIPNVCPLPLIQELLDVIKGATIFSKLDM
ncbi:hypothetical protein HETIRDRAFT_454228 [Heterobasidion irregulare TC 32-1]|uniref:Reverse transcriptase domain-containing protein n=1 Tax=Heterobasidion irregulare (strain TC 32-1) TaxID=747525 RepID=W4JYN6_HETIT|nr:uncharacterized protein HETIRDRAFT_454228 [Heterobasidion irregulare TC 32-1]ETW78210.1 hypothetical protein HETIRDRAFT_454228 [Heterobasidion irregulare TC 32-1]